MNSKYKLSRAARLFPAGLLIILFAFLIHCSVDEPPQYCEDYNLPDSRRRCPVNRPQPGPVLSELTLRNQSRIVFRPPLERLTPPVFLFSRQSVYYLYARMEVSP